MYIYVFLNYVIISKFVIHIDAQDPIQFLFSILSQFFHQSDSNVSKNLKKKENTSLYLH